MFKMNKKELQELGAEMTTKEIYQQPELWQEALENFLSQKEV